MILAFDTYYRPDNTAFTVCIGFHRWEDTTIAAIYTEVLSGIAEYQPGEFYKRELPCILSLWSKVGNENRDAIEAIVVDGFVYLDDEGKYGLGGYLYEVLHKQIPVIGVAKTNFATIDKLKVAVLRGESKRPVYVTAIGIDVTQASAHIQRMDGSFRLPFLLKELDRLTKAG